MGGIANYGYGEELKILESQLNENSISGILVNEYDYPISGIIVRAEFYDKEDGHLVGVRDLGWSHKDPLGPNEESSYKIPEFDDVEGQGPFPKTDFIVKAEGFHDTTEEIEEGEGGLFAGNDTEHTEIVINMTAEQAKELGLFGLLNRSK